VGGVRNPRRTAAYESASTQLGGLKVQEKEQYYKFYLDSA